MQNPRNQGSTRTLLQRVSRSGEEMVPMHYESVADATGWAVDFMLGDGGEARVYEEVFPRGRERGGAGEWQLVCILDRVDDDIALMMATDPPLKTVVYRLDGDGEWVYQGLGCDLQYPTRLSMTKV